MALLKRDLLCRALVGPALESFEEVGTSADNAVEIKRLEQEKKDIMEIHALEQDVALIERYGEGVEELQTAVDEVGEIKASMESYLEKGGMTASDAANINRSLKYINRRLGGFLTINTPATESFQGPTADRITLTVAMEAEADGILSKMWKAIKDFFKGIIDKIKGWFGKAEKKSSDVKASLTSALAKFKNIPENAELELSELGDLMPLLGKHSDHGLSDKFTPNAFFNVLNERIEATKKTMSKSVEKTTQTIGVIKGIGKEISLGDVGTSNIGRTPKEANDIMIKNIRDILNAGGTASSNEQDGISKYASVPLIYGKKLHLELAKADEKTQVRAITLSLKAIEKAEGAEDPADINPVENAKFQTNLLMTNGNALMMAFVESERSMREINSTIEYLDKDLNANLTFNKDVNEETKTRVKGYIDALRNGYKMLTNGAPLEMMNDVLSLCTKFTAIANKAADKLASANNNNS